MSNGNEGVLHSQQNSKIGVISRAPFFFFFFEAGVLRLSRGYSKCILSITDRVWEGSSTEPNTQRTLRQCVYIERERGREKERERGGREKESDACV